MKQIRKKHKFSLPITITVCIALAIVFYLSLSYFLEGYRRDIYDRIINSNISALKETTSTLFPRQPKVLTIAGMRYACWESACPKN